MKIRQGFVSNSSSSSFIIAYKKADKTPCPTCGRCDLENFVDLIERSSVNNDDNSVNETGLDDVTYSLEEQLRWREDPTSIVEIKLVKKEIKRLVKEGWEVANISISYHDETLNNLLHSSQNIKILYGEND